MNYKQLLSTMFLVALTLNVNAQKRQKQEKNERIEALKVAFITKKLNLSPSESEGFWPLYNEMEEKIIATKKSLTMRRVQDVKSDEDAQTIILKRFGIEQQALNIKKEYFLKLIDEIGPQKVIKINQIENQFKRELLNEVRNRRGMRKNR